MDRSPGQNITTIRAIHVSANKCIRGNAGLTRTDATVDFLWGGGSPQATVTADNFSVKWTGRWRRRCRELHFTVGATTGVRLFINGVVLDGWSDHDIASLRT
jgi:hypothetical protein